MAAHGKRGAVIVTAIASGSRLESDTTMWRPHFEKARHDTGGCTIIWMTPRRLLVVLLVCRAAMTAQSIQPTDLWKQQVADADRRLAYSKDDLQFGELRLPKTKGPHPVVVLVHGGCFVDRLPRRDPRDTTFEPLRPLAAALADAGVATWNLEYRRAGNPGGG
jgi:acetyl esterase/lipase